MIDKSLSIKKTHGPFTRQTLTPNDASSSSQAFNRRSTDEGTEGYETGSKPVEEFKPSDIYFGRPLACASNQATQRLAR
jgi:hypothetical protein